MKNAEARISHDLRELGISSCYRGEEYTYLALKIIKQDPHSLNSISKQIYPTIAKQCATSPACVERNLRTFISTLWEINDHSFLEKLAGRSLTKRPSNGEFLSMMYNYYVALKVTE